MTLVTIAVCLSLLLSFLVCLSWSLCFRAGYEAGREAEKREQSLATEKERGRVDYPVLRNDRREQ